MDLVYYLRKHTYRLKYKQNLLRRITTYVYENLKRNMTTFTPDIYCWLGSASLVQHPLHRTFLMVNDQLLMINEFIIHNLQLIIKKTGEFRPLDERSGVRHRTL